MSRNCSCVVNEWNLLPQEVVDATSVNLFKNLLDKFRQRWALKAQLNQPINGQVQVQVHYHTTLAGGNNNAAF